MTEAAGEGAHSESVAKGSQKLAILLAAAMFVLVVDTSLMNVSISAVIPDLHTTASGVQSAIALEALVSAAFILINSKVATSSDASAPMSSGLLAYAVGALAMTLAQNLLTVIIFWAIIGGLGASLLLPAMQSLIHGNFEGPAQKRAYALVGASAAIAAAVGPLLGGFVTTYLSWRVGFLLEVVIIAVVLAQIRLVKDVPYTGSRKLDVVGAILSIVGMGGVVLGILVWQEGGEQVLALIAIGLVALAAFAWWISRRHRSGKATLLEPRAVPARALPSRDLPADAPADLARRRHDRAPDLPPDDAGVQRDAGGALPRTALPQHVRVAILMGKKAGRWRSANVVLVGFVLTTVGMGLIIPLVPRADFGWHLIVPLVIAGSGLGMLVSQLNNFTLAPIAQEQVSEAAGVNSAAGSFGLSFGLAVAGGVMLAVLSFTFTNMTQASRRDP